MITHRIVHRTTKKRGKRNTSYLYMMVRGNACSCLLVCVVALCYLVDTDVELYVLCCSVQGRL